MQTTLKVLDQALRIQRQIPADEVAGHAEFLVAHRERPCAVHRFTDEVLQLARRNPDVFAARGAIHAGIDFNGATGRGDDLDAQVRQARMTDVERQACPGDLVFTIDNNATHQRQDLEGRDCPLSRGLQSLWRQ